MITSYYADLDATMLWIARVAAVSACISAAELLVRPKPLLSGGLMSWGVGQLRARWLMQGPVARAIQPVLEHPRPLLVVQLLAGLFVLFNAAGGVLLSGYFVLLALCSVMHPMRSPYGLDGADQMMQLTFVSLSIWALLPETYAAYAAVWFLALQSCLSYVTSGVTKLVVDWWNGTYLGGVLDTQIYGHGAFGRMLKKSPIISKWMARCIILFECLFPLTLVLPDPWLTGMLMIGGLFHLSTAILMGLNTFFWSFIALYPAVYFCAMLTQNWLYG